MAAITIVKFLLTWFLGNVTFIVLTPQIRELLVGSGLYNLMPPSVLQYAQNIYFMWLAMIFLIPLVIIIKSWREAELKAREG